MQKNQFKKSLLLISLLAILVVPTFASADGVTIVSIVKSLATTISLVAGFITVICWIITGLMFMTAQGDPGKFGNAKKALFFSIAGTAITLLAGTAPFLVGSAIGL